LVIRPELPAQYIQQLPNIENLLLHLEGKGRSENTRTAYEKNLKALAIRADLKDTKAVELAIARYKKKKGKTNDARLTFNAFSVPIINLMPTQPG